MNKYLRVYDAFPSPLEDVGGSNGITYSISGGTFMFPSPLEDYGGSNSI